MSHSNHPRPSRPTHELYLFNANEYNDDDDNNDMNNDYAKDGFVEGSDGDGEGQDNDDDDELNGSPINRSGLSLPGNSHSLDPFDERFYPGGEFDADDIYVPEPMQEQTSGLGNAQIPRM